MKKGRCKRNTYTIEDCGSLALPEKDDPWWQETHALMRRILQTNTQTGGLIDEEGSSSCDNATDNK